MKYNDIDPFGEEEWEEVENLQIKDICDVIYGIISTYYSSQFYKVRMVNNGDEMLLMEKNKDIDADDKLICSFTIHGDKVLSAYDTNNKKSFSSFNILDNLNDNKVLVHKTFKFIFDEYLNS